MALTISILIGILVAVALTIVVELYSIVEFGLFKGMSFCQCIKVFYIEFMHDFLTNIKCIVIAAFGITLIAYASINSIMEKKSLESAGKCICRCKSCQKIDRRVQAIANYLELDDKDFELLELLDNEGIKK